MCRPTVGIRQGGTCLLYFITTDMYLPIDIIKAILSQNGYFSYEKLYISSELGLTKRSGKLFNYILDDNRILPKQLLHIGDNFLSDIIRPKLKGIKTFLIKKNKRVINKNITLRTLTTFLQNATNKSFGYQYFGSLLYGFVKWLDDEFKANKFNKILFLSREGYLIKKAYEIITSKKSLNTMYFYASRRALQVPSFIANTQHDITYTEIIKEMFLPYNFTVAWLLKRWGLHPDSCLEQVHKLGLDLNTRINKIDALSNQNLIILFNSLKEKILENANRENNAFLAYIEKNDIHGNIAIVDIGWHGNMQRAFKKNVAKYPINVVGYYFAIENNTSQMKSYVSFESLVDLYIITALELFFMANHGTVIRYSHTCEGVDLADFEYTGTETEKIVKEIQENAIQFLNDFKYIGNLLNNESKVYTARLFKMFRAPTLKEISCCENLQAWDEGWLPVVKTKKLSSYIRNLKILREDFLKSTWKIGFLKNIFKISAPYYSILQIARRQILKLK